MLMTEQTTVNKKRKLLNKDFVILLQGVGADKTQVIKGLVLLAAVAFDVYNKRPGHVSITKRLFNLNKAENKEGSPAEKKS